MLILQSVSKTYDGVPVVHDLNLEIPQGELFCILGVSGAGKSTLLRLISGLERDYSGKILLNGSDLKEEKPFERSVNLMQQGFGLIPTLSVERNILLGLGDKALRFRSNPADQLSLKEVVEQLDISDLLRRPVKDLSGGEKQRVALARLLIARFSENPPSVWLFDEPFASLDNDRSERLCRSLKSLHQKSNPPAISIYVTHNVRHAYLLADRVGVMEEGEMVQVGTPSFIEKDPQTLATAKVFGPLNVFGGKKCIIGVRPRDMYVAAVLDKNYSGTVTLITDLGPDQDRMISVQLQEMPEPILIQINGDSKICSGDTISFGWKEEQQLMFDFRTGRRLSASQ
ncbi:hypothetical protein COB52_01750 [Candidatus Kaiserbacteria bacterium]|nr:MAG: hypothetical protein COB52_01750 [Candidatus Kaiserbacteria bacterium]